MPTISCKRHILFIVTAIAQQGSWAMAVISSDLTGAHSFLPACREEPHALCYATDAHSGIVRTCDSTAWLGAVASQSARW
ncbi:hypothetical protein BD310DRAFT_257532 [Dichomitus squalens]|uniref:Secreted protein n=1 Tax=Dichomitus squalens TaxID=114155 RepID=A0A4Q9PG43_9APHY|nr:hypothetical protein BD310DRAFT_257532 [Dichomitus squalens]